MRKCEKIDGNQGTWMALPDMREGKCWLNPCLFNGCVYLCGFGSQIGEAFSPHTNSFLSFTLQLPDCLGGCLYVQGNLLVLHSIKHVSKYIKGKTDPLDPYFQRESETSAYKYSSSQPVVDYSNGQFFIIQLGKVQIFNMETGRVVQSVD